MDILYRVADTKGGLRGSGYCYGQFVSFRGYQGWSKGGGGIVKGILYRVAGANGGLRGGGGKGANVKGIYVSCIVYNRIVSHIPRVV